MITSRIHYNLIIILITIALHESTAFVSSGHRTTEHRVTSKSAFNLVGRLTTGVRLVADTPKADFAVLEPEQGYHDEDWIPAEGGGFIPNLEPHIRKHNSLKKDAQVMKVTEIEQYKREVADVTDQVVCVRFYAPWCRACKEVEGRFRNLAKEFPDIKFVEVPVTQDNVYLHRGLGIPSLPFAHVYHPDMGLAEERKLNKNVFREFKDVLQTYQQETTLPSSVLA